MSTMENADVKGDISQTNELTPNLLINSNQLEAPFNNNIKREELEKNYEDSQSNDQFLKRKRDAEITSSFLFTDRGESKVHNPEDLTLRKDNLLCSICDKPENQTGNKLKTCKICNLNYHLDCLLSNGQYQFGENFICISCRKEMNSSVNGKNQIAGGLDLNNSMIYPQIKTSQDISQKNILNLNDLGTNINSVPSNTSNSSNFGNMSNSMPNINNLTNSFLNSLNNHMNNVNNPSLMNNLFKNSNSPNNFNSLNSLNNINSYNSNNQFNFNNINNSNTNCTNNSSNNSVNINPQQLLILQQLLKNEKNNKSNISSGQASLLHQVLQGLNLKKDFNSNISQSMMNPNLNKQASNLGVNCNPIMSNPLLSNLNKQNSNITNFNIINNLINCSNYNNINAPNQSKINKNILINQMCQQINNMSNFPNFMMGGGYNSNLNSSNQVSNSLMYSGMNNNFNVPISSAQSSSVFSQILQSSLKNNLTKNASNAWTNNTEDSSQNKMKKFPIEDSLLLKNPDKYEIDIETYERPEFTKLKIPEKVINKVVLIWDFLNTFNASLSPDSTTLIENLDIENIYENLEKDEFFNKAILSLLHLFINTVSSTDSSDFTEDKELLIFKTLKENINTDPNIIYQRCWADLLSIIIRSKKFSLLVNDELKLISNKIKENEILSFSIYEKISILFFLVNSAYDTSKIKNMIQVELDKKNEITKEKSYLENEYRNKELRKRELEKSEKFLNAAYKIESLNTKLEELENNKNNINLYNKQRKDLETEREKYKSLLKENDEIQIVKEKIIQRLKSIKSEMQELKISSKRMIGQDVYKNEYYFFNGIYDKIYVKKYENKEDKKNKNYAWVCYNNKDDIQLFVNRLLEKGNREKKLKRSLNKILLKKLKFKKGEDVNDQNVGNDDANLDEVQEKVIPSVQLNDELKEDDMEIELVTKDQQNKTENSVSIFDLSNGVEIMKKIEEKFSEYLSQYNKEWEIAELRNKWKEIISEHSTLENCKTSLLMLNLRFKNPYRNDEPPISDEDNKEILIKPKPKFIFRDNDDKEILSIYEYDQYKLLAPKVKIWSKDLEINEMDKFYTDNILPNIKTSSQFFLALHFYESILFSLIKRREPIKKNLNLIKEISEKEIPMINEALVEPMNEVVDIENKIENHVENLEQEVGGEINDDKTVSISPDQMDVDKTESVLFASVNNSDKKIREKEKENITKKKKTSSKDTVNNTLGKKKRTAAPKDLRACYWRETCYICDEYGNLICCDGCTNVAHQFCACLDKIPENWYCEKCVDKEKKSKKKSK